MTIKGKVVDKVTGECLSYATVFLKSDPDMEIIKACVADEEGRFILKVPENTYWLCLSFVGYSGLQYLVKESRDMGELVMMSNPNMLQTVEVKPLIENSADKITYNIVSDPERDKLSVSDILKKVPMVKHNINGDIYVDSPDKKFLVILNGKVDALFSGNVQEILKKLPASGYTTVRLLLAPPEWYGECDYILDIVTDKKVKVLGAVGQTKGEYVTKNNSIRIVPDLTFSSGRIRGMLVPYALVQNPPEQKSNLNQIFRKTDHSVEQSRNYSTNSVHGGGKGMFSYDVGERHFLSLGLDYNRRQEESSSNLFSSSFINKGMDELYQSYTKERKKQWDIKADLSYQIDFTKKERIMNLSGMYSYAPQHSRVQVNTVREMINENLKTRGNNTDEKEVGILQVNYSDQWREKLNVETGVKYTFRHYQYENGYMGQENISLIEDSSRYSKMDKRNQLLEGYFKIGYSLKNWKLGVTLYGEYLEDGKGTYIVTAEESRYVNKNGFILYPKVELFRHFQKLRLLGDYEMEVRRPGMLFLNPKIIDPAASIINYGNPDLNSEKIHRYRMFAYWGGKVSQDAGIIVFHSRNLISSYWYQDERGKTIRTYRNYGKGYGYTVRYNFMYNSSSFLISVLPVYSYYNQQLGNGAKKSYTFNIGVNAGYRWKDGWSVLLLPSYRYFHMNEQEGVKGPPWGLALNANKKFLKNRMEFSLSFTDLINIKEKVNTKVFTEDFEMTDRTTSGCFGIYVSLSYRWGNFQVKPVSRLKHQAEDSGIKTSEDN